MRSLAALTGRCACSPTDRADVRDGEDHGLGRGDVGSLGQGILVAVSAEDGGAVIAGIGDLGAGLRRKASRTEAMDMRRVAVVGSGAVVALVWPTPWP